MDQPQSPERAILEAALKLPPKDRAAYFDRACGGDALLRQRVVDALFRAEQEAVATTEAAPGPPQLTMIISSPGEPPGEQPGGRIGNYKLVEQIGEGGMGSVWVAEQTEPVRREVALKVIKLGMDTKQVIARFEAERQALALMDHPNIAKVLDAGATNTGRPFFVMERIKGVPITKYCDDNKLDTRQRLDLFIQVCQAIQHAHQKGIIHRDIKPSNILVVAPAPQGDGRPVPKVIDFGIAKATGGLVLTEKSIHTMLAEFIGTPAYMSPEQAEMGALDVDTRSDIYSLGVLLYELLTSQTPFDALRLLSAGLEGIRRIIREEEPPRPSTRLSTLDVKEQTTVAARRQTEPPKLVHLVRGDLDWIVMKALEKDRTRRYDTANGFGADIQRFLSNEPVVARPPSEVYRFQKLVRRNKLVFAMLAAMVLVLAAATTIASWLALRARNAERRADANAVAESRQRAVAELAQKEAQKQANLAQAEALRSRRARYAADMFATQYAAADGNVGTTRSLLREYVPRPGEEDLRGFEWRYWSTLSKGRQTSALDTHGAGVYVMAWSPDGKSLASGSADGTVRLWTAATGKALDVLDAHAGRVISIAFSPTNRNLLATGHESGYLNLWSLETRSTLWTTTNPSPRVVFSPSGGTLAVGVGGDVWGQAGGSVELRDAASGRLLRKFLKAGDRAAFSPDGARLATANGETGLVVWDLASGRPVRTFPLEATGPLRKNVLCLTFSPDSRTLAFGTLVGAVGLWDLEDEKPSVMRKAGTGGFLTYVSFSPDGAVLATAHQLGFLELWDALKNRQLDTLFGHTGPVAFSPDGKAIASGGGGSEILLWNPHEKTIEMVTLEHRSDTPSFTVEKYSQLGNPVISPDSRTIALRGSQNDVQLLDPLTLQHRFSLTNAGAPVAFTSDGKRLLTHQDFKQLQRWDLATATMISSLPLSLNTKARIITAVSEDQALIAVSQALGLTEFLDTGTGKVVGQIRHSISARTLSFSRDGNSLAVAGTPGVAEVWEVASKTRRCRLEGHTSAVSGVAFSPDGKVLATASWDATLKLWDVSSGELLATLSGHRGGVGCCAFSEEGRTLVSSGDTIKFWNLATRREVASFPNEESALLLFSRDGSFMLSGVNFTVRRWRAQSFVDLQEADKQALAEPNR